jgi:ribonuclease BN (tRNA processing enzyme)
MSLTVVLLGSGGWIPTAKRETCSLYVRKGTDVLVLDAGTGLRHLVERPDLLADSESLFILLSHFHLDHVVGLGYLPALELSRPPEIWGPGESLYDASTAEVLGRILESPFFTPGLSGVAGRIGELREDDNRLGRFSVVARRQDRHPEPSLAFRVDDEVAYCSDTGADDGNTAFASGCKLLYVCTRSGPHRPSRWRGGARPDSRQPAAQ